MDDQVVTNQIPADSISADGQQQSANMLPQVANDPVVQPTPSTDPLTNQPTNQQSNEPTTQSAVDDVVAQGSAIQDLFAQNDNHPSDVSLAAGVVGGQTSVTTPQPLPPANAQPQPLAETNQLSDHDAQVKAQQATQQPSNQATDQRSPLDILEEILSKEQKKDTPVEDAGPTPEELQQLEDQKAAELVLLEDQRQRMIAETQTSEQKQRDQIRQQQSNALKIENPHEIRQLERKK